MGDKKTTVRVLAGAMIIVLCIVGYLAFMRPKPTMKIGYIPIIHHLLLGVSEERDGKGFKNFKLEAVKFKEWTRLQQEYIKGNLDGVFILAPLGMDIERRLRGEGRGSKVVLLAHRGGSAITIRVDSGIKTAADFKGKTIAIPHRLSIQNILLYKVVTEAGLDYKKDIGLKVMAPPDMPYALVAGEIDGYVVAEPYNAVAEDYGYGKIFEYSQEVWPQHICCIVVISEKFLDKNPKIVQELVDSLVRSGGFTERDPDSAAQIGVGFLGQSKDSIYRALTMPDERIDYDHLMPEIKDFNEAQDYLVDIMGVAHEKIDIDEWVTTEYAAKAFGKIGGQKALKIQR